MTATDHRQAVQDVDEGNLVDVGTDQYDFTNPLKVTAVHSREIWETPAGPDIVVADFELDGARTTYAAEYNGGHNRFLLESASVIYEVTEFTLVDDTDDEDDSEDEPSEEATGEATPEATDEPTQDDDTEADDDGSSVSWTTSSSQDSEDDSGEVSADGGTAAKYTTGSVDLDPSEHAPDDGGDVEDDPSGEWDMSFDVPDGITQQQVRSAVQGNLSLQGVLESLEWPDGDERARGRVRAMVFELDLYQELVEPESWDRDRARQRGWQ